MRKCNTSGKRRTFARFDSKDFDFASFTKTLLLPRLSTYVSSARACQKSVAESVGQETSLLARSKQRHVGVFSGGVHLFPFRTESLSLPALMVLRLMPRESRSMPTQIIRARAAAAVRAPYLETTQKPGLQWNAIAARLRLCVESST